MTQQPASLQARFETKSPMGHLVLCEYNPLKQAYEGHVIDGNSGLKYPLSDEILDGIEAAMRAETAQRQVSDHDDDWSKSLLDIKQKQALYLRKLVGQAADFLVIKPQ